MKAKKRFFGFSQNVFILSIVSFLNDIGGETIKKAIPLFLTNVLGAPLSIVGLIEGVGESAPQIFQPLSGFYSDKLKKRKPFVLFGQALRSVIVVLFFVVSWPQVLIIRFLDRTGKGISNAPRDALISLSAKDSTKGRAFGLNRTLDNAGAVIGLALAGLIVLLSQKGNLLLEKQTFAKIVMLAAIPLVFSFVLIFLFIKDKDHHKVSNLSFSTKFSKKFYQFLLISFLFTLGNSSDGFLILRAQNIGVGLVAIFFLLSFYNLVSSLFALPAGSFSDRVGRKKILILGWLFYALTYFGFGKLNSAWAVIPLFLLYGVYFGLTEGVAKAYVADLVPEEKRGTAFGIYNMTIGLTLLPASFLAGILWQSISPRAPFYFGAVMAGLASTGLLM
ncbi:MFS transporter, partial [Candidatus Microgenomates bacterium]|nr:MFS transporter [Candidatus Microgenomates bacterium]